MSRRRLLGPLLGLLLLAAALAPLLPAARGGAPEAGFPGWPASFEGRRLTPLSPAAEDAAFAAGFPGRIARFSDGRRQVLLRWVAAATRRLHPAAHCFAGVGYAIEPLPLQRAADGALAGCFAARRGGDRLAVCERVQDGRGGSWADVSSWYWSALLSSAGGGWWSIVTVERLAAP
ncbi:MAG: hypothetical protein U1E53_33490 [Dongiaceae bacterium]